MTQLRKSEEKSTNPMAGTWSKAAKVRRAFKAGRKRKKDLLFTPERAMFEGCILLLQLRAAMAAAGLKGSDAQAALVLMSHDDSGADLIYVAPIPAVKGLSEMEAKLVGLAKKGRWVPLGIVLRQTDHEAKDPESKYVVWAEAWLTGPRAVRALIAARDAVAGNREGTSTFS